MNNDHLNVSALRVVRLALITALFVVACGFPDSLDAVWNAARALVVD